MFNIVASYVVGDIHGCYSALMRLLAQANFQPEKDTLWCIGDLVNRGGDSVLVLEYLYDIRSSVRVVLGNHDCYLLALMAGNTYKAATPELSKVIEHPQASCWFEWLRRQPLAHYDRSSDSLLVHAGIPHIWTIDQVQLYADEVHQVLAGDNAQTLLHQIYGNNPELWSDTLEGVDRWRCIINYLTRMRFITADGRLDMNITGGLDAATSDYKPWFSYKRSDSISRIIFGHWAALRGDTAKLATMPVLATDTGCVWGGSLSLFNLGVADEIYSV